MNTTNFLSELVSIEISLLVSKAKLALCDFKECGCEEIGDCKQCYCDMVIAADAEAIASECGLRFENVLIEISNEVLLSTLLKEVITEIKAIYSNLPPFLKGGFNCGVGDVQIARAGLD